tara:strand:+ start:1098 stop:1301 length:204 start_codon:yes stop_codon:yes gene_type:complete
VILLTLSTLLLKIITVYLYSKNGGISAPHSKGDTMFPQYEFLYLYALGFVISYIYPNKKLRPLFAMP